MKGSFEIIIREDLSAFAPQVKVPTLIIWGRKDRTLPVKAGFVLKGLIDNSTLRVIEEADHSPHRKMPEKLSRVVLNFLQDTTTGHQAAEAQIHSA